MRPGFMLYLDLREPFGTLADEQVGRLVNAAMNYVAEGTEPEFEGMERIAWMFLRQSLDRDAARYDERCVKASRAARKRWSGSERMPAHAEDANSSSNGSTSASTSSSASEPTVSPDARPKRASQKRQSARCEEEQGIPSLSQVAEYVKKRKSRVDPGRFLNYYQARNWIVGSSRIRDWRAACRAAESWSCWDKEEKGQGVLRHDDELSEFEREAISRMMARGLYQDAGG